MFFEADYLVFPDMFASKSIVEDCKVKIMADRMKSNGTKIIFGGMGGERYNEEEINDCTKYFESTRP